MMPTSIPVRLLQRTTTWVAALVCAVLFALCPAPQAQAAVVDPVAPEAPTDLGVQPGDRVLTVTFLPPAVNEATSIDGYEYSLDGGSTWSTLPLVTVLGITKIATKTGEIRVTSGRWVPPR